MQASPSKPRRRARKSPEKDASGGQVFGQERRQAPRQAPRQVRRQAPGQAPGQVRRQAPRQAPGQAPPGPLELMAFGGVILGYLAILGLGPLGPRDPWWPLVAPNAWLLVAALAWASVGRDRSWLLSPPRGGWILALGAVILAAAVSLVGWWAPGDQVSPGAGRPLGAALVLVFAVPITEELFFRGALLARLEGLLGRLGALGAVSLLFAFLHLPGGAFWQMLALSVALSAVTLFTGQVGPAVLGHVAWNGAALLFGPLVGAHRLWLTMSAAAAITLGGIALGLWSRWRKHGSSS